MFHCFKVLLVPHCFLHKTPTGIGMAWAKSGHLYMTSPNSPNFWTPPPPRHSFFMPMSKPEIDNFLASFQCRHYHVNELYTYICTGCPTDMETRSDQILQFSNPHMSKSKTCFEKFVKKSFRWHLETQENQIGSIFKLHPQLLRDPQFFQNYDHVTNSSHPLANLKGKGKPRSAIGLFKLLASYHGSQFVF